jgi:branched-chain amino acid transport system permease protein
VKFVTDWRAGKAAIIIVVLIILVSLPLIFKNSYWHHLFIMGFINSLLGMTFSVIFCCAGMVSLGTGAFFGIGAYASTMLVMVGGWSFWLALPAAFLITGIIASVFGLISIRNPGVPFVLLTMIFAEIITQITGQIQFFGGWGGFIMIPRPNPIGPIEFSTKVAYYYLILCLFLLVVMFFKAVYTSRIGRVWKAVSLSPRLAETLGINVYRYRVLAFVIASSAAGLVGSFYAHYAQTIAPQTFGGFFSILVQLYPILGGIDFYILGPILGAGIMTFIPEYLRITKEIEPIITGLLLLAIIIFFPRGIIGSLVNFPHLGLARISNRMKEISNWLSVRGSR